MKIVWFIAVLLLGTLVQAQDFDDEDMGDDDMGGVEDADEYEAPPAQDAEPEPVTIPREERPVYKVPKLSGDRYFVDTFENVDTLNKVWIKSQAKKDGADDTIAKYDGQWAVEEPTEVLLQNDLGLVLKSRAKHHAIAAKLDKPFTFDGKPLVVQYEVNFQNGQECGGSYVKLLSEDPNLNLKKFYDKTPYTIMFGPDKCGNDDKLHFIFRHKNPVTGEFEEKHAKKPTASLASYFTDKKTHLYTLVVSPDNTFTVYVDQSVVNSGSLLEDMTPPVNPPKEIVDPDDKKPADWDEHEKIPDPTAKKPEDWDEDAPEMIEDADAVKPVGWLDDEPALVPNPDVEKPADWDDDMDGEFEAPLIDNPKCKDGPGCGEWKRPTIKNPAYKGKWSAPTIDNPNFKGYWQPKKIANPAFFEDKEPYKMTPIVAVGLELWSMSDNIIFDNFIITGDKSVADSLADQTWRVKQAQELVASSGKSVVQAVVDMTNERPWLWVVIALIVLMPVVLIIKFCLGSSKDEPARRKKTDAPVPDVALVEAEASGDEEGSTEKEEKEEKKVEESQEKASGDKSPSRTKKSASKKASKSDLEAEEADDGDGKGKNCGGDFKVEDESEEDVSEVHLGDDDRSLEYGEDSDIEPELLMEDGGAGEKEEFGPRVTLGLGRC